MKVGPYIELIILVVVFGSALSGMLIRRLLPESHLSDETKGVRGTGGPVAVKEGHSTPQHWMLSQAKALTSEHRGGPVAFGRAGRARNSGSFNSF